MQGNIAQNEIYSILNAYTKNEERPQINNLNFHLRKLEKEQQIKTKASRIK